MRLRRARGGVISVSLKALAKGNLQIAIEDDGVGMKVPVRDASVGSRLMRAFSSQVHGTATMTSRKSGGTRAVLVFPDPADRKKEEPSCAKHESGGASL